MTRRLLAVVLISLSSAVSWAEERFPPPDFTSGHKLPVQPHPAAQAAFRGYGDMAVLAAALVLATWLVLRKRSRRGVYALMVFSIAYFGFWRGGCVCPIGAIQNVAQALCDSTFVLPLVVTVFFFLPLVFTLLFGRMYCAAVCPHGALQDAILFKPLTVPAWLNHGLGLLAYLYLGLAVLFAATGSAYPICEYDPFVALFRHSGTAGMLVLGGAFLVLGLFVGRPYCRYLCPYGAILRPLSLVSRNRVKIYPDRCIDCHLCDNACPFSAIHKTTHPELQQRRSPIGSRKLLVAFLVLLPVLVAGGAWLGSRLAAPLSRMHSTIRLAERIKLEEAGDVTDETDPGKAFRRTGRTPESLYADAGAIYRRFKTGSGWLGAWIGLVVGLKLISLAVRRRYTEYEADRALCVACARCFAYCPGEKGLLEQGNPGTCWTSNVSPDSARGGATP
ncbi:MAG: 4Fe-4S binding protein [Planctomycetota bacterium]|nr:4Fe-4S binding protein [Planctomycetota bacterium]